MRILSARLRMSAVAVGLVGVPWVADAAPYVFQTVVNSGDTIPSAAKTFNSFNQPSINATCLVVFRGRSTGGQGGEPMRGVYTRQACGNLGPIKEVLAVGDRVPQPNNTAATFNEFPAFPRITLKGEWVATRGQSQPVWEYALPDGSDTRVGTSGIYVEKSGNSLKTAASLLGAVPGFAYFSVPGASVPGTRFDQFPGAPSPTGTKFVVFKGNYTDGGVSATGIFFRNVLDGAGKLPTRLIASTSSLIPRSKVTFGSTAPPTASDGNLVFLGLDN